VFRENDWIDEVGHGQTTISVSVSYPEVQHKVRIQILNDGSNREGGRLPR
jgi:hypothetical protein